MAKARLLPSSEEAEIGTICSLLMQPSAVADILHGMGITREHYQVDALREIFSAIMEMTASAKPVDLITVTIYLRDTQRLDNLAMMLGKEAWKGAALLTALIGFYPTATMQVTSYAETLAAKLVLRKTLATLTANVERCYTGSESPRELVTGIITQLESLTSEQSDRLQSLTPSIILGIETKLQSRAIGAEPEGLMTGIEALDNDMGGILPARYYVLAAAEKLGKTALSEQIMQRLMIDGNAVLSFQRDMNVRMMVERMACREAGLVFSDFDTNRLPPASIGAFRKALLGFNPELLRIHSPHAMTPADMRAILKHELRRRKIAVVFLDVFTRLKVGHDYVEGLARASDEIRQMVADFGVPWMVLAHVSRESEKGEGRPQIRHLKWCKGLAVDADSVGIMWSDEDPRLKENKNRRQLVYLSFDANRGNDVGDMELYFDRPRMKFHGTRD